MPESMSAAERATITNLAAGRDRNLLLAKWMEDVELYADATGNPLADELPQHLRSAAERLDELIEYLK
jgi:hypothetical protein